MHLKTLTPERQVSESGYRFYSPTLGRWVGRDPIGEVADQNLYCFLENAAVSGMDVLGLISYRWETSQGCNAGVSPVTTWGYWYQPEADDQKRKSGQDNTASIEHKCGQHRYQILGGGICNSPTWLEIYVTTDDEECCVFDVECTARFRGKIVASRNVGMLVKVWFLNRPPAPPADKWLVPGNIGRKQGFLEESNIYFGQIGKVTDKRLLLIEPRHRWHGKPNIMIEEIEGKCEVTCAE